jgi:hypothetical protein
MTEWMEFRIKFKKLFLRWDWRQKLTTEEKEYGINILKEIQSEYEYAEKEQIPF